jgi:hypothetical protein
MTKFHVKYPFLSLLEMNRVYKREITDESMKYDVQFRYEIIFFSSPVQNLKT